MDFTQPDPYPSIGPGSGGGEPISGEPCQQCGQGPASVQTYMWVMSFVLLTRHLEYPANLCRACATRTGLKEQAKSALLGWWGIPWGLMTFKALWVNARSLMRWSTLPAATAALTLVAGLAVPTLVAYGVYAGSGGERQAQKTGDWVDQKVVDLMDQGNAQYEAGLYDQALESYSAAYEQAPRSSVVNSSMAQTLIDLGQPEEALPYAARAAELDPDTPATVARHGYLLVIVKGPEAAQAQATELRAATPGDVLDSIWMADFFDELGDHEQQLRAARAGLAVEPGAAQLTARELAALVELDRLEEAAPIAEGLDEEALAIPYAAYARDLYRMRTEPEAETGRLESRWLEASYTESGMAGFVRAAERADQIEEVRSELRRWLHDPETPGEAWASARPWFTDSWTEELDRYLEDRPEPLPALLRLRLYDPLTEAPAIRRLAARAAAGDHPLVQWVDSYLYGNGLADEPLSRRIERLEAHLAATPDHVICRSILAGLLARSAPERAALHLQVLDEAARADPDLRASNDLGRAEMHLALGEFDDALATISKVDPESPGSYLTASQVDLTAAEAAFHAGKLQVMQKRLRRLLEAEDPGAHGAALLIRWSQQLALDRPITYREDVDALFARHGDALLKERSASVQGILIAEGRVDRREREAMIPREQRGTLELVRIFHDAAESGTPDLDALERLAASPDATEYAPLLVRTALERRSTREAG